jgi:Tol biopolymer transport system component
MYFEVDPETKYDLWVLPMATDGNSSGPATPRAYLRTQFAETNGSFSPEPTPHWVVYQSDESGRNEVYVRGFPEAGEKIRVSTNGGVQPRWSPVSSGDKLTLFYTSPTRKLMTVDLKLTNGSVAPGPPHELFALPQSINGIYRVSANGRRFLVQTDEPRPPATVLVNWTALLK